MLREKRPAAGARPTDDARRQVWISLPELAPWQARFDFLVLFEADTETGEPRRDSETREVQYEYVCVGSALEGFVSIGGAEESLQKRRSGRTNSAAKTRHRVSKKYSERQRLLAETRHPVLTRLELGRAYSERRRRFNEEELRYQHIAELKDRFRHTDADKLHGRTLHRDSATIARVWRSLDGTEAAKTYAMMEIFGVSSRTTIHTWLKRAREDGELDASDLTGRNRPRASG